MLWLFFGLCGALLLLAFFLQRTVERWIVYDMSDGSLRAGWRLFILEGERELAEAGTIRFLTVGPGFAPPRETLYAVWARLTDGREVPFCDFRTPLYDKAVLAARDLAAALDLPVDDAL